MTESKELQTIPTPECFPKDWTEPEQERYWACEGTKPKKLAWYKRSAKWIANSETWITIFASAEESEAHSVTVVTGWVWNGCPAKPILVKAAMTQARRCGHLGVEALAFRNGQWVVVHQWLAGEPIPASDSGLSGKNSDPGEQ